MIPAASSALAAAFAALQILGGATAVAQQARSTVGYANAGQPAADAFVTTVRRPDDADPLPGTDGDGSDGRAPLFGRPALIDGVLQPPPESAPPVDGVLVEAEPPAPVDGVDPNRDTRTGEEAAAFEIPGEASNEAEFALSNAPEPEPTRDRRPERLFRFEPYNPVGVRLGSFILFPEAELGVAATNNLFRSPDNARSDVALEGRPAIRAVSNWNVHALEVSAKGLASFYGEYPSEDDRAWSVEGRGRLDITRRTNVEALASHDVTQDSRGSANFSGTATSRDNVTTDRAGLTLNHRFNRLTLQLRGAITDSTRTPPPGTGETTSDRDYVEKAGALRASWEFKPTLSVFAEAGVDERTYQRASFSDGIRRDSTGERYRAGVSFGNTDQILRGEVSIGTATQHFDDTRLQALKGVIVDGNVAWRMSGLTSLLVTAASNVGDTTVADSGGVLGQSVGVELRHALRRHLIATAGLRYVRSTYAGVSLVEQELTSSAMLEYYLNRNVTLFGRYAHIDFDTTNPGGDYTADEVRVGVRVRR
jgi:hypothetical protein